MQYRVQLMSLPICDLQSRYRLDMPMKFSSLPAKVVPWIRLQLIPTVQHVSYIQAPIRTHLFTFEFNLKPFYNSPSSLYSTCDSFPSFQVTILYLSQPRMPSRQRKPFQFGHKINLHDELPSTTRQITPASPHLFLQHSKVQPPIKKTKSQPHKSLEYSERALCEEFQKTERQVGTFNDYTPDKLLLKKTGGEQRVKFIQKVMLSPKQQVELLKLSLRYIREENQEYLRHRASAVKHKIKNKIKGYNDPPIEVTFKSSKPKVWPQTNRQEVGKYNQQLEEFLVRKNMHQDRYQTATSEEYQTLPESATSRDQEANSSFRKVFRTLPDVPTNKQDVTGSPSSFLKKALSKFNHDGIPAIARMLLNSQQLPKNSLHKRSSLLMSPKIKKSNNLLKKSPCSLREHVNSLEARYFNIFGVSQDLEINTHREMEEKTHISPHFIKGSMNHNLIRKNVKYFKKDVLPHLVREVSKQKLAQQAQRHLIGMNDQ